MKKLTLTLLALALCSLAPAALHAQMIGVNFGDGTAQGNLAATASAGVSPYAQTNWNNVSTATSTAFKDNSGIATSARLTLTNFQFATIGTPSGADEILNNGLVANNANSPISFTLANIPYTSYSLVVYSIHDITNQVTMLTLGNTTYYLKSPGTTTANHVDNNAATAYLYVQGTATTAATATTGADYVIFTGLSGLTQTFSAFSTNDFGEVQGFQIVNTSPIPEPSTYALALLGGAGLLGGVARQRRAARLRV